MDEEIKLIDEYNAWVLERKRNAGDTTPGAFMVERAKDQAMTKLIRVQDYINKARDDGRYNPTHQDIEEIIND